MDQMFRERKCNLSGLSGASENRGVAGVQTASEKAGFPQRFMEVSC
jgi:hypothetical protein